MKIGVLYVGIGKYICMWNKFHESSEKFFLPEYEKEYFVFTDYPLTEDDHIHVTYQENIGWPGNVLYRYNMFLKRKEDLERFDYLFFFNGNTEFLQVISPDVFLPTENENFLTGLSWHIYEQKPTSKYPYERRKESKAYIPDGDGKYYYQAGLIGGQSKVYIELLQQCDSMTQADLKNNIITVWHDESYLNKYLLDKKIKVLSTEYGRPQEWKYPLIPKIIFRDKNEILGLSYISTLKSSNRWKTIRKRIHKSLKKLLHLS